MEATLKAELVKLFEAIATRASCAPHDDEQIADKELTKIMHMAREGRKLAESISVLETPKPNLVIVTAGGIVQGVYSDQPDLAARVVESIYVLDYDSEGADESDLIAIPQPNGDEELAYLFEQGVSGLSLDWPEIMRRLDAKREENQTLEQQALLDAADAKYASQVAG